MPYLHAAEWMISTLLIDVIHCSFHDTQTQYLLQFQQTAMSESAIGESGESIQPDEAACAVNNEAIVNGAGSGVMDEGLPGAFQRLPHPEPFVFRLPLEVTLNEFQ